MMVRVPAECFLLTIVLSYGNAEKRAVGSYGGRCVEECKLCKGWFTPYYCCVTTKDSWDYCSPTPGTGSYGYFCKSGLCDEQTSSYTWCSTENESWDYCSTYTTVSNKKIVASYGGLCKTECTDDVSSYSWCESTKNSWDYCSSVPNIGAYGYSCITPCATFGYEYRWCEISHWWYTWDYCSDYTTIAGDKLTRYGRYCESDCEFYSSYYYCYDYINWDYCSPIAAQTYQNEPCKGYCGKHGEDYYWCYTKSSWDYCSPIENCGYWPALFSSTKKQRNGDFREICRINYQPGRSAIIFVLERENNNAIMELPGDGDRRNALNFIHSIPNRAFESLGRPGTLYTSEFNRNFRARIDLQGWINRNGRRFANMQVQVGSNTIAAILVDSRILETSDAWRRPPKRFKRALFESIDKRAVIIIEDLNL